MLRRKKNWLCGVLVLTICLLFSACAPVQQQPAATGAASSGNTANAGASTSVAGEAEGPETVSIAGLEVEALTLPITENGETLSLYVPIGATIAGYDSWAQNTAMQAMMERTGLNFTFIHPPAGTDATEYWNLTIASGEWPDMWRAVSWANYKGGLEGAINDGLLISIKDLVLKYSPNFLKLYSELDEEAQRQYVTDSGELKGYGSQLNCDLIYNVQLIGPVVRKDLLEQAGLATPVTYDDWYEMLLKFKEMGVEVPMALASSGNAGYALYLAPGFHCFNLSAVTSAGSAGGFVLDENGNVVYCMRTEGWKEFLTYMNKLYANGLIDSNFINRTTKDSQAMLYSGQTAVVGYGNHEVTEAYQLLVSELPEADIIGLSYPVKQAGDIIDCGSLRLRLDATYQGFQISTTCENPVLAVKFCDYLYSDEGLEMANYGVEYLDDGTQMWTKEDGHYAFTDFVKQHSSGLAFNTVRHMYMLHSLTTYYDDDFQAYQYSDRHCMENFGIWSDNMSNEGRPTQDLTLTYDESSQITSKLSQINTYTEEESFKFITGQRDLAEFDDFAQTLISMGIEDIEKVYAAANERYYERKTLLE